MYEITIYAYLNKHLSEICRILTSKLSKTMEMGKGESPIDADVKTAV